MLYPVYAFLFLSPLICLFAQDQSLCLRCGSKNDLACVTNPNITNLSGCGDSDAKCFSRVDDEGYTLRGCESDLSVDARKKCNDSSKCILCDGKGCNNQIFPHNRLRCYNCTGAYPGSECASEQQENKSSTIICESYNKEDQCYITKNSPDRTIHRGCKSDNICGDEIPCKLCSGDNCNTHQHENEDIPIIKDEMDTNVWKVVAIIAIILASVLALIIFRLCCRQNSRNIHIESNLELTRLNEQNHV